MRVLDETHYACKATVSHMNHYVILVHSDFDECESSPCVNGGTCKDGVYTYTCECLPEHTGVNCESGKQVVETLKSALIIIIYLPID